MCLDLDKILVRSSGSCENATWHMYLELLPNLKAANLLSTEFVNQLVLYPCVIIKHYSVLCLCHPSHLQLPLLQLLHVLRRN